MNDTGSEGEIITRIERAAPAENFAAVLMQMLADPDIPADKMEVVMKMRREVLGDQAREAFMEHFAALSAELPQVERDGTVELAKDGRTMGRYNFTTIESDGHDPASASRQARLRHFVQLDRQQGQRDDQRHVERVGLGAFVDVHAAARQWSGAQCDAGARSARGATPSGTSPMTS